MKRIASLIISILCLVAATSCSMSEVVDNAAVNENNTNQQDGIRLSIADTKEVSVYSTALENENRINRGIILVWHAGTPATSTPDYGEQIDVTGIVGNGTPTPILPQLKNGFKLQAGDRVYILINATIDGAMPAGLNENNINEKCSRIISGFLRPTSVSGYYGKINSWSSSNNTCVMTRSMAKVTVRLGETVTDVTGNFRTDNVLYRMCNYALFQNIMPVTPLRGKRLPLDGGVSWIKALWEDKINDHSVYIGEFPNSDSTIVPGEYVDPAVFSRNRTFVLVEKVNAPADTSFYRLDFYDNTTKKFMDIERNHHYVFTINKVRSEGYKVRNNAWANPSSNIEYTVTVDDGAAMTSNGQYAIVTSVDTAIVYGNQTNYTIATARYVLPAEMSSVYLAGGTVDNNIAVTSGTNITLNAPTTLTATNQEVKITSTAIGTSVITFRVGNINHRLVVIVQPV